MPDRRSFLTVLASLPVANSLSDERSAAGRTADALSYADPVRRQEVRAGTLRPEQFGAVGDGDFVNDVALQSASNVATSPSERWSPSDVGKSITIRNAGGPKRSLITTIASVTNAGSITLARAASASVRDEYASWGTDDSRAFGSLTSAIPRVGPNLTRFGPTVELDGSKVYYLTQPWRLDRPASVYGQGAVIAGHTLHVGAANSFATIVKDLTVVGSAAEGFWWERGQGLQSYACRAIGNQTHGHRIGGVGTNQANYGRWFGLAALYNGDHGLYIDAGTANMNANAFTAPVLRSSGGYGIYMNDTTGLANYNDFFSAQIEGNARGSVFGGSSNDNTFFGGHFVDSDDGRPPLVMEFRGRRNRLIGGRIIGAQSAVVGITYRDAVFREGGMRSAAERATRAVDLPSEVRILTGMGAPEGEQAAPVGSLYLRLDGGATSTLYVKTSGAGRTGWTAK